MHCGACQHWRWRKEVWGKELLQLPPLSGAVGELGQPGEPQGKTGPLLASEKHPGGPREQGG